MIEEKDVQVAVRDGTLQWGWHGDLVEVPAGKKHNFLNAGPNPLILYTVYGPPEHADGAVVGDYKVTVEYYRQRASAGLIISEATKRLSPSLRQQHPQIPWREMAGMRNVIVHKYDQLDFDILWDVVQNKLSELLGSIEVLLSSY